MKSNEVIMHKPGKGKNAGTIIVTTVVLPSEKDAVKFVEAITDQGMKEIAGTIKEEKNAFSA